MEDVRQNCMMHEAVYRDVQRHEKTLSEHEGQITGIKEHCARNVSIMDGLLSKVDSLTNAIEKLKDTLIKIAMWSVGTLISAAGLVVAIIKLF